MLHTIAGQEFKTGLRPVKAMSPVGDGGYIMRYKLQIAGGPILTKDMSRREADDIQAVIDKVLEFVATQLGEAAK